MSHTNPCDQAQCYITAQDLPLCCPLPSMPLWNAHPRVYLPIEKTKDLTLTCPYCDTQYILTKS